MQKIGKLVNQATQELKQQKQLNQSLPKLKQHNAELARYCPTGEAFLNKFNYDFCVERYRSIESMRDGIMSGMVTLKEIAHTYNEKTPELMLQAWLVNLAAFMAFEITPQQARETARYMFEELRTLSLPLVTLLFKRLKKGKYGEFYGKFNGQKILIACIEFRKEYRKEVVWVNNQKSLDLL